MKPVFHILIKFLSTMDLFEIQQWWLICQKVVEMHQLTSTWPSACPAVQL
jgi:hypothetical protein